MLRWHYRSRHPSLIEVSNAEFYGSSLFLPPAPTVDRDRQGLLLRRVPGAYDRGGKRTNAIEAQAIVEGVASHAAERPGDLLGIVTFSTAQRDMVSEFLEERRRIDPVLDSYLHSAAEEVFVKILRTSRVTSATILVSVGYGPRQAGGRLDSMNFGPVSSDGGERRLSVLFTRARHRCEVFVSFDFGDIDIARATGEGPRVLKRFLAYAETGVLDQPNCIPADYDSAFEEDLVRVIGSVSIVDAQVGSAGFRIDLAVRDPDKPGRYILAVECDGATYHSALWARERDRLRQQILEDHGWRFHRYPEHDWFHRRRVSKSVDLRVLWSWHGSASPAGKPRTVPAPAVEEPARPPAVAPPAQRPSYQVASFAVGLSGAPHEIPVAQMADIVGRIVEIEGPIYAEEVGGVGIAIWQGSGRLSDRGRGPRWFAIPRKSCRDSARTRSSGLPTPRAKGARCATAPPLPARFRRRTCCHREIRAAAMQAVKENGGMGERTLLSRSRGSPGSSELAPASRQDR